MILNFGSINIDHVYGVSSLPRAGETITSRSYERHLGGKGLNQSIAMSLAGGEVIHIGAIGKDAEWILSDIAKLGVDIISIARLDMPTGHAIISVDELAENQIILFGGANHQLSKIQIDKALEEGNPEIDWVCLQNETNLTSYIAEKAKMMGYKVAYSAAPFIADIVVKTLPHVDLLAVNEIEAEELANILNVKIQDLPIEELIITKGIKGAEYNSADTQIFQEAFGVDALDTTGAGDTYFGSFLTEYSTHADVQSALRYAAAASALQVTKHGAADAIPTRTEVLKFLQERTHI